MLVSSIGGRSPSKWRKEGEILMLRSRGNRKMERRRAVRRVKGSSFEEETSKIGSHTMFILI